MCIGVFVYAYNLYFAGIARRYSLNDSSVSESSGDRAVTDTAYVLFYRRRTGSLRWAGIVPLPEAEKIIDED
jgi:hypothetical protein